MFIAKKSFFFILAFLLLAACTSSAPVTPTPSGATPSITPQTPTDVPLAATTQPPPEPTPKPPTQVRFAVIGDYGQAGPDLQAVAELVTGWNPDILLTVGDNNYPDGAAETIDANIGQYFHEYIGNYIGAYGAGSAANRFFPTLGNHDWDSEGGQPYRDYFTLPGNEYYYEFSWGPVHFFALDSDSRQPDGIGRSTVQGQWLQAGLAASTAPWQVVYFHVAPYSSGTQGDYPPLQWPFAEWGADLVIAGHDHVYERLEIDGLTYITNGLGGGQRYFFEATRAGSIVRYREAHGALFVLATADRLQIEFINVHGDVIDAFQILP